MTDEKKLACFVEQYEFVENHQVEDLEQKSITASLVRKIDKRLLPLLGCLYLLSYIDRSNIGNAKLGGLEEDLGLSQSQFQWSLSIFYFSYALFDIPSNIMMRRWKPSYWLGTIMFLWGIVATVMAASQSFAGLLMCRFFLGVFEAGFFPGVTYYMTLWYTRQEYGRRLSFFWSFSALAGAFGGLIAYGISQIHSETLRTWQLLFIIEGIPSVLLAGFSAWYLPNSAKSASFLNSQERELADARLAQDAGASDDHSWSWAQVASVFTEWKTYLYIACEMTGGCAMHGVNLFMPSIVANMGTWSKAEAQALTTPPYILTFIFINIIAWNSDRVLQRAYHLIGMNIMSLVGYLLLIYLPHENIAGNYIAVCLVTMSNYASLGLKITWFANNYYGLTRRAIATGAIISLGTIGGALGGQIYFDPPHYFYGNMIAFFCIVVQLILVITLRIHLARENKRRSNLTKEEGEADILKYGTPDIVGDRHYTFRYVL